jgi:hypothetical protein
MPENSTLYCKVGESELFEKEVWRPSKDNRHHHHTKDEIHGSVSDLHPSYRAPFEDGPKVGIALKVIAISDLRMTEHSFSADVNVNVAWKGDKKLKPKIQFYNILDIQEVDPPFDDVKVKEAQAGFDWFYRVRCRASFRQRFELHQFPFDEQTLRIQIRLKEPCKLVHLPWGLSGGAFSIDPRCVMDEFVLMKAHIKPQYLPSLKFGKIQCYDAEAQVELQVAREPMYWVTNYGLMSSILTSFSFISFALPAEAVSDRLELGVTMLLTIVASKYLMGDKLPKPPYFTLLEKHMITCMLLTFLIVFENTSASISFVGVEFIESFEGYGVPTMLCIWFVYHLHLAWCTFQYVSKVRYREKRKKEQDDKAFRKRFSGGDSASESLSVRI